jgi:twitching motility protein PilT
MDYKKLLNELLTYTAEQKASDLHLSPGHTPMIRLHGQLVSLNNYEILDKEMITGLTDAALGDHKARFSVEKEVDFSYSLGEARFRTNVYITQGVPAATFRYLPSKIPSPEDLNLPPVVKIFSQLKQGFVLVVGPNGQGKTTAMASLIDLINHEKDRKIVTIEDPIEYIYKPDKSIIDQREVLSDTLSFHKALRSTFRQNVDVILVGEMRDLETMSAAVTAAETGHLVFASLHTNNAAQTVERIIDSFPADQQPQIRIQLANTLSGVVSRRLIPNLKGGISAPAEILLANSAVRNLIRENKLNQINMVIETSYDEGMLSFNRSLVDLVFKNEISEEQAEFYSLDPAGLKDLLR